MRTLSPVASESGGLLTSRSESVKPCTTSTSVPRLRPILIGLKLDRIAWADHGHFHPALAEHQRAGRDAHDVGIARQFEIGLRIGAGLQRAVRIFGMELNQQRARIVVDGARGGGDVALKVLFGYCGRCRSAVRSRFDAGR